MPSQRQSRARRVVKGMAALEPAPHRNKLRVKNIEKHMLEREREREGGGGGGGVRLDGHHHIQVECDVPRYKQGSGQHI